MLTVCFIIKVFSTTMSTLLQPRLQIRSTNQNSSPADGWSKKKTATVVGKWWLATSSRQCTCPFFTNHAGFFLAKLRIIQVRPPQYSPDLAPCDFWLFPKLKSSWKGEDFRLWRGLRRMWQGSWWWSSKRTLQTVLKSGRDAGISVWYLKESTLKGTKAPLSYIGCIFKISNGWILSGRTSYIAFEKSENYRRHIE